MIARWIESALWRVHDWRAALEQLAIGLATCPDGPDVQQAAVELGVASEYIEPDRRRAVDVYGLAGPAGAARAVELVTELGWWAGRARLLAGTALLDEAESWWDAGLPELCTFALAGVRTTESARVEDLALLAAGDQLDDRAAAIARRAETLTAASAADTYVMAARFARAAGAAADQARWLEAALAARPGHAVAAAQLLRLTLASRDPDRLRTFMRVRFERLPPSAWVEGMRTTALAMVDARAHRGFGLRLLRRALERAYQAKLAVIPGHLAMWMVLAAHGAGDNTRRELLELALAGLQACQTPVDRVWLGALAAEISLRDAGNLIVAGAYAELVAEHAPDHPIVHELIASVARDERDEVSPEAVAAATTQLPAVTVDEGDRARIFADAIAVAIGSPDAVPIAFADPISDSIAPPAPPALPAPTAVVPPAAKLARPTPAHGRMPITITIPTIPLIDRSASSAAKPRTESAVPAPPPLPPLNRPPPTPPPRSPRKPSNPEQLFAALRTPDRPTIPPPIPDPPGAIPRSRRISLPIDVRFVLANGTTVEGHSRDLSTTGMFVMTTAQIPDGEADLDLVVLLPGEEAFSEQEFRSRARIIRRTADGIGVTLIQPAAQLVAALAALIGADLVDES